MAMTPPRISPGHTPLAQTPPGHTPAHRLKQTGAAILAGLVFFPSLCTVYRSRYVLSHGVVENCFFTRCFNCFIKRMKVILYDLY